jgi:hypothetical protein
MEVDFAKRLNQFSQNLKENLDQGRKDGAGRGGRRPDILFREDASVRGR